MCKKRKCSARGIIVNDSIQKRSGNHNHAGEAAEIDAAKAMEKVKEHAINSQDTPHYIVPCASMEANVATAVKLDLFCLIATSTLTSQKFTKTIKGDLFFIYDSGPTNDRILIFATQSNLDILARSEHWYSD